MIRKRSGKCDSLLFFVALLAIGCQKRPVVESENGHSLRSLHSVYRTDLCQKGVDAFSKTVHPHVRGDCLPCHDVGGLSGIPHSTADVEKSYSRILGYVNFSDLEHSFFVTKGGNRHCLKHGGSCKSTEEDIRSVLMQWWEQGQKECPNLGKYLSRPAPAPQTTNQQVVVFGLSHLTNEIGNSSFSVRIRREGDFYFLSHPRLVTPDSHARVSGLTVLINGKLVAGANAWSAVLAATDPASKEGVLLSGFPLRIPIEKGEGDEVSFAFANIEKIDPLSCRHLDTFEKVVMPELEERTCYRCHGGGPSTAPGEIEAKKYLDMNFSKDLLCKALLLRGNGKMVNDSPLIALPLRRALGHPQLIPLASEILPAWSDWIRSELGP